SAAPRAMSRTNQFIGELGDGAAAPDRRVQSFDRMGKLSAEFFASEEAAEGRKAFFEKRAPRWARCTGLRARMCRVAPGMPRPIGAGHVRRAFPARHNGGVSYSGDTEVGGPADLRQLTHLTITKLAVGPMDNNTYLLRCRTTGEAVLIDAAAEADRILELIGEDGLARVITTHRHQDHWQALAEV